MRFFALSITLLFTCQVFAQQLEDDFHWMRLDVVYLSSDLLKGRETGTDGATFAADYIARRFEALGLQPKGNAGGWYQEFPFKVASNPHKLNSPPARKGKDRNVVGYLDNGAANTVIIGAHYDHLGMGQNGSSLSAGEPAIHNGADDNASGVASMLYLAKKLKDSGAKQNNYLFIAFSGEELGLIGSKYFAEHSTINLATVSYMLNMDMVGRLNEEKALAIYGTGTSPVWNDLLNGIKVHGIQLRTSESGVGPSDHTSFYLQDIPVLHFFTGQHSEYHKPEDDAHLVNFQGIYEVSEFILAVIEQTNDKGQLTFTPTKQDEDRKAAAFKVTLGVMPDYVFGGPGMRIDGVLEDRPAKKAGLKKGDVVIKIGEVDVEDIYGYMEGLAKFNKGDKATVVVKRGDKLVEKEVEF